jgi:DNA end-binding protein Ku
MAARAVGSGTISFGLVSIPVKFYSAESKQKLEFHMLHKKCGTRVRMQYFCPYDKDIVSRRDMMKGFEHAKDQFVQFTDEELERLESDRTDRLEIMEFVPEESVDLVYVENTRYVGPSKGGERAYRLLADSMARMKRIAVGRYGARGREQLVLLRPYKEGLAMHQVYYADEVRRMEDVDFPRRMVFRDAEMELADRLIEQLSTDAFQPEKYHDDYRDRVLAAVEQKVLGQEIAVPPEQPQAQVIDLFEALKRSLSEKQPRRGEARRSGGRQTPPPSSAEEAGAGDVAPAEGGEQPQQRPIKKAVPRRRAGQDKTGTG